MFPQAISTERQLLLNFLILLQPALLEGLANRNYSNWGLKQLTIKYKGGRPLEHDLSFALTNSFPSLLE